MEPVEVDGDSILFRPVLMELGRLYCVELHGKPYVYKRINEMTVEIYEPAS